jgi:molybdate transport system substrate-binding protein
MPTFACRLLAGVCCCLIAGAAAAQGPVVFAAASMRNALDEVAALYATRTGVHVTISYAGSSALARQIEAGAPADVFISADLAWMDYLDRKGLVQQATRHNLLGNRLVLVAPAKQPQTLKIEPGFAIARALGEGRIALAEPNSVPAGKYAKAAFEKLGVWSQISGRVAAAANVRAALALVARGEVPLGVVYRTDARADPTVMIAGVFPENTHPPIVYPVAALKNAKQGALAFIRFLSGTDAAAIFEKHGFAVD